MDSNTSAIIIASIAATPPTLVALLGLYQSMKNSTAVKETHDAVKEVHKEVNGRLSELIAVTKKDSKAEGVLEGENKK